jgi:DNA transposition AAA+ family ATPase
MNLRTKQGKIKEGTILKRKASNSPELSVIKREQSIGEKNSTGSYSIDLGTWETQDFIQSIGMCYRCRQENVMGLLIGPPGSGKTVTINSLNEKFEDILIITARVTMTVKDFLDAIAQAINITVYGSNNKRFEQIAETLKKQKLTLVIDETENLIKSSISKIEIARQLHDITGIGIIFCGTPRLEELIIRGPNGRDNLAQLYSRMLYRYELQGLKSKEVTKFLTDFNLNKESINELKAIAMSTNRGGIRVFTNVLGRCLAISQAKGQPVTKELIREVINMMIV